MMIRRSSDPNVSFLSTDGIALWCYDIVEFRIETRNKKFLMTPIMRDGSDGPMIDASMLLRRTRNFCES